MAHEFPILAGLPALRGLLGLAMPVQLLEQGLPAILKLITGEDPQAIVLNELGKRLSEQEGRSGGKLLGRAVCEQIDTAMESATLASEHSRLLGHTLAQSAALASVQLSEAILRYSPLQAEVVRLKRLGLPDTDPKLQQARLARDNGARGVREACVNIGRVAAGDPPVPLP